MRPHFTVWADDSGNIYLGPPEWLTLHCPLTVHGSPAFLKAVPRAAMIRMVQDYHRGIWGRTTAADRAAQAGRPGYLTACYGQGSGRVHVVTDHEQTWFILATE
jgi:hypothetical protein